VTVRAFGPGRVNLVGEHTDYNGGLCLPFAIEQGVTVEGRRRADDTVLADALDLGERDEFTLGDVTPAAGWRAFVRGTVAELQRAGHGLTGCRLAISADLPRGAGLSSSAALETALALALLALAGEPDPDRRVLAGICSRVENDWVGAQTGLLDQMAALFGAAGHAIALDMRTLAADPVGLALGGWHLAVQDSGVAHAHAESGYNERRRECREACRLLGVASLRDADPGRVASLPEPLRRRARHVLDENQRVRDTLAALDRRDLPAVGRLLDACHVSLRDLFEVSVPEVEHTRDSMKAAGAAGARIMGGGFGGAVLGLFAPGAVPPPGALAVAPADGARLL